MFPKIDWELIAIPEREEPEEETKEAWATARENSSEFVAKLLFEAGETTSRRRYFEICEVLSEMCIEPHYADREHLQRVIHELFSQAIMPQLSGNPDRRGHLFELFWFMQLCCVTAQGFIHAKEEVRLRYILGS